MDFDEFTDSNLYKALEQSFKGKELNSIARKCWHNCKPPRGDGFPGMFGSTSHSLIWAFNWKDTKEGDEYWRGIWERM